MIKNIGREYAIYSTVMCCLQKPGLLKPGFLFIAGTKEKEVEDGNIACFENIVVADKSYRLCIQ